MDALQSHPGKPDSGGFGTTLFWAWALSTSVILFYYLPATSVMTENIGLFISRIRDNSFYTETVYRIIDGLMSGDGDAAFSGTCYSYGFGYFILLAIFAFPGYVSNMMGEGGWGMAVANVAGYILFLFLLLKLYTRFVREANNFIMDKTRFAVTVFGLALLLASAPAPNFLFVGLHPEIWQGVFVLFAVLALLNYFSSSSVPQLMLAGGMLGAAMGFKIGFVAPLVCASLYLFVEIFIRQRRYWHFIGFCLICGLISLLLINPAFYWAPGHTFARVIQEYRDCSGNLEMKAIADWNYYIPLSSQAACYWNWLVYPYNKAFIGLPLTIAGIIACSYFLLKRKDGLDGVWSKVVIFVVVIHCSNAGFLLLKSSRISSFYLIPTFLPLVPLFLGCIVRYCQKSRLWRRGFLVGFTLLVLVQIVFNTRYTLEFDRLASFIFNSEYSKHKQQYDELSQKILSTQLPKRTILLDTFVPLSFSRSEFGYKPVFDDVQLMWSPRYFDNAAVTSNTERIIRVDSFYDEGYSRQHATNFDVVVVSKNTVNFQYLPELLLGGLQLVYQNDVACILSRHSFPSPYSGAFGDLTWGGDTHPESAKSFFRLDWGANKWQGVISGFGKPVSFNGTERFTIKLNVVAKASFVQPSTLRFGFRGCQISSQTDTRNSWHVDFARRIAPGVNTFELSRNDFNISTGRITWNYVESVFFGGVAPGLTIEVMDIIPRPTEGDGKALRAK